MTRIFGLAYLFGTVALAGPGEADPWAAFREPEFDHLTARDGLPDPTVTAIAQDSHGFIWVGTFGGLARYDGHRTTVVEANSAEPSSLPDVYVRSLLALPQGDLLVALDAGGVSRVDGRTLRVRRYPFNQPGTPSARVYQLSGSRGGAAWVASERGLYLLQPRSGRFDEIAVSPELVGLRHFSVLEDSRGWVWVGTDRGLWLRARVGAPFRRVTAPDSATSELLSNQVWSLYEDQSGGVWIGGHTLGVARAVLEAGNHLKVVKLDVATGGRTVRAFAESASGALWIATDGDGVIAVDSDAKPQRELRRDHALPTTLRGNTVRALTVDRNGNLWVGTDGGVSRRFLGREPIWSLRVAPHNPRGLSQGNVRAILLDRRGRVWLGQSSGSIDVIDLKEGTLSRVRLQGAQATRDVQALVELGDGTILAGSTGIAAVDPDSLRAKPSVFPQLDGEPIGALGLTNGQIWIATYDGVYIGSINGHLTRYVGNGAIPRTLGNSLDSITPLPGSAWLSGATGLVLFNPTRRSSDPVRPGPHLIGTLLENRPTAPVLDSKGDVWIGTERGLVMVPKYEINAPLPSTVVRIPGMRNVRFSAVLIDSRQRVWGSLAMGLVAYDPATRKASFVRGHEGLLSNGYIRNSAATGPNGEMLFGGSEGLTLVSSDWNEAQGSSAPLTMTRLYTTATESPRVSEHGSEITLPPHARGLRADFALLDYRNSKDVRYSYRLVGVDEQWTHVPPGALPTVAYSRLPPGRFTLELTAQIDSALGEPKLRHASYEIVAEPRWHETATAKAAYILLAILTLGLGQRLRSAYLERRSVRLQHLVDERTQELQNANSRLDELASRDPLTGLLNRRRFTDLASRTLAEAADHKRPIAILMLDLDEFKRINDSFGHPAGDAVLREAAVRLMRASRATDVIGRWGGEELIVCLSTTGAIRAPEVAERIRSAMAVGGLEFEGRAISFTVSIGVAVSSVGSCTLETLVAHADAAMYAAKRAGRNRVVIAGPDSLQKFVPQHGRWTHAHIR